MGQMYPVAGSKLYIGLKVAAASADLTISDFTAQNGNWLEVDGWTNAGTLGDTMEIITQAVIGSRRVRKAKGTLDGGTMENTFIPMINDPGQIRMREAEASCKPYAFKIEWGAGCTETGAVTISNANPAVVTWAGHGLEAGSPVVFTTTGALPTGLTAGTTYYVLASELTATTFQVSDEPGGDAIATSSAGSGTHTATAQPAGQTDMFYALVMPGAKQGGEANTAQLLRSSLAVDSNIVEV